MNGDPAPNGLDWSTFGKRQYFYGVDLGKDSRRDNGEFDHLHLDLFYADRRVGSQFSIRVGNQSEPMSLSPGYYQPHQALRRAEHKLRRRRYCCWQTVP